MQTRLLFITFAILIAFFGFTQKAEAQRIPIDSVPIVPLTIEFDTMGYVPIYCNSASGADAAHCDSEAAAGNLGVYFGLTVAAINPVDYGCPPGSVEMLETENFRNNTSCEINFVTCSMVEYAAPIRAQFDTEVVGLRTNSMGDSIGLIDSAVTDYFGTTLVDWIMTPNACATCSTGCNYTCTAIGPTDFVHDWSYYFGCTDVDIPPGQSVEIGGMHAVDAPILATHVDPRTDTAKDTVILSQKQPYNPTDSTTPTWNFHGIYMDFVKGCQFLSMNGCDFDDEPGQAVALPDSNKFCAHPFWDMTGTVDYKAYRGRSYPTGIVSFPIGNQTMSTLANPANDTTVYPAKFEGMLIGAPANAELMIYAPEDTSHGACVIDSGWLWTHALSGCQGDTLKFEFPFVIPPRTYAERGMTFVLYFPSDSCSNVGNGKRIYLNGQVMAHSTTPLYDSGAYMYSAQGTMIMDTTPPVITSFITVPVDSTHLAISMTGVDDTTMLTVGCVVYTINGGPKQLMPLRYANNLAVGDTTVFKDTLVSSVSRPVINIKGFVQNQVGLIDSSIMEIFPLKADPQSGVAQQEDSLPFTIMSVQPNPAQNEITVMLSGQVEPEVELYDVLGRKTTTPSPNLSPSGGEEQIVMNVTNVPTGIYFIRLSSGSYVQSRRVVVQH